jgi:hypothetical protein
MMVVLDAIECKLSPSAIARATMPVREPITGERKGSRWLLLARGFALEVNHVGVRHKQFIAYVTLCLRAFSLADLTWYVN